MRFLSVTRDVSITPVWTQIMSTGIGMTEIEGVACLGSKTHLLTTLIVLETSTMLAQV